MVESMTGFGRAQAQADGYSVEAEIRSVNNRYCDVSIKLPGDFQQLETKLRTGLQQQFGRGKISVSVKLEQVSGNKANVRVNQELAASYLQMLRDLRATTGISEEPGYNELLHFSDIFERDSFTDEQKELIEAGIEEAVQNAAKVTIGMRREEGKTLATDILSRIDAIEEITTFILSLSEGRVQEAREKLQERVKSLLDDDSYDKERLELEIALLADKLDITEEIVRLNSHLSFFRDALKGKASAGRKLNFLMQEMLREINTIGSKSYNAEIAHKVVDAKEIIEIIREQIQNLV